MTPKQNDAPERVWVPLPYAAVCSTVDRPDLPQQEYVRADKVTSAIAEERAKVWDEAIAIARECKDKFVDNPPDVYDTKQGCAALAEMHEIIAALEAAKRGKDKQ